MLNARSARRPTLLACVAFVLLHAVPLAAAAAAKPAAAKPAAPVALKFSDIYKMPVGPKGLEPTDTLRSLDGKRVRMVGYVVQQENPAAVMMIAPLPVLLGEEDEGLADDLPPTAVAVHPAAKKPLPKVGGLVEVTGVLELGTREDAASGRVSSIHLVAEPKAVKPVRPTKTAAQDKPAAAAKPKVESP